MGLSAHTLHAIHACGLPPMPADESWWRFHVTCPCGGDVRRLAAGKSTPSRTNAVLVCVKCGQEMLLTLTLEALSRPPIGGAAA